MTNVNKLCVQLKKINGSKYLSSEKSVQCNTSINDKVPNHYLAEYSIEQVCQQACAGNKDFIVELIRRAEEQEIGGDYIMANELYKKFIKGLIS